tara:strand:- start:802 stop:1047 length:246 start_codon:yes stop_codon:yes gene_type:complete
MNIKEGTIVKGNVRNSGNITISGMVTKYRRLGCAERNDVEILLAEILFQTDGYDRAIYAYAGNEFHIIKDCPCAPAKLQLA